MVGTKNPTNKKDVFLHAVYNKALDLLPTGISWAAYLNLKTNF